jgi:UDP-N-acetylmuramoyl-tripeptide--D-alanyl-D-alanine ligase
MSFSLGELRTWIEQGGIDVRLRRADGSAAVEAIDDLRCRGAVTDSRQVEDGFLFCAVQGEAVHGVDFLRKALASGAVAALVEGQAPVLEGVSAPVLEVDQARKALAAAARGWLDHHGPRVIGITGSNGKTTTKDFLGAALGGEFPVSVSPGNLNSLWGLPLAVLGFRGDEDWLVLEMGASGPGEVGRLAEIAQPWMGCVTNIAPAHLEGFGSVDEVARTKAQLLQALPEDGVAVINADDPRCEELVALSGSQRKILFGRSAHADVRIEEASQTAEGLRVRIAGRAAILPVFGEMNAHNAAAAVAMARFCGVSADRALERISRARLSPHRSRTCACGGRTVVDDTYNANPVSMRQALDSLAMWPGTHSRVAVLADMAELGPTTVAMHREVIDHALRRGLDLVLVAGPLFAEAAPVDPGPGLKVMDRVDVEAILDCLQESTHPGDLVLLKGSRSAGLERVLDAMTARWSGVISNGEPTP